MSWSQSILPAWKVDNQNTTQPERRNQNTCEDRSLEYRRHLPHQADVAARQTATPSNLQLPSRNDNQRQNRLHATHRISTPFQRDPFRCDHAITTDSFPLQPTHSVGPSGNTAAYATHSVAAVRPVASRIPVPYTKRYTQSSKTVLLPTEQRVSHPAHHPSSATGSSPAQELGTNTARVDSIANPDNEVQPIRDRDPEPTATYADQLGATQVTSQGAAATTATADVTRAVAGGKGPSCTTPDGPSNDSEEDKMAKSAFYRNATFTRRPGAYANLVLEELQLRNFDGDIREYNEFRDNFLTLIESDPSLAPAQKLQQLLKHLEGTPHSRAEGYGLCDAAYWEVLDMLECSYGDQQIIRNTLLQDFVDIPPPADRREDLTRFHDEATKVAKRLKRVDIDVDKDSNLYPHLMELLPLPLRFKLIQGYGCRGANKCSCLLDSLHQYISDTKEAEEYVLFLRRPSKPAEDPPALDHRQFGQEESSPPPTTSEGCQQVTPSETDVDSVTHSVESTVNVVDNNSSNDHLKERRTCPLCGIVTHFAANCFMYPTIQKRLRRVLKLKICLLCLRGGHRAEVCPKRKKNPCKTCGHGQHHRIVCKDAYVGKTNKELRPSQMRATTGSSRHPANSDQKRHFRKKNKSVTRNVTSILTSAPLRQGKGTQRSSSTRCKGNPTTDRKKRTRNQGATSKGQAGTSRPSTNSSDERKQQTAKASGNRRLLPARHGQLKTEPSSTTDGPAKFHREPREAEEDSSTQLSGGDSDNQALPPQDPSGSTALQPDAIYCASTTTEPTTLLECIKATAENPVTGNSREALIFFDSGSSRSFVSTELACELNLPRQRPCSLRVSTFGNELPTAIEGFSTSIVLRSKHRRLQPLAIIAGDCIVPSVRTALIDPADLNKLRRSELSPPPIQVTPDILIGQDLVSHFKRQYGPTLPSGFYVVHSILGPTLGGAGQLSAARGSGPFRRLPYGSSALYRSGPQVQETLRPLHEESPPTTTPRLHDGDYRTLSSTTPSKPTTTRKSRPRLNPTHSVGPSPKAPTTLQTIEATRQMQPKCPMCDLPHDAARCSTYVTIQQRLRRAGQRKLCFLCLQIGHWSRTCPNKNSVLCDHCQEGRHHQALCRAAIAGTLEADRYFCSLTAIPPKDTLPQEAVEIRHTPSSHTFHPLQDAQNPLDITEPLLQAFTTISSASSDSSTPPQAVYQQEQATFFIGMMPKSRKTRLISRSDNSCSDLGYLQPRKQPSASLVRRLPAEKDHPCGASNMSDSDSDIAAASHRESCTFRAPANDDVNSDEIAATDKRRSAPDPTHSVGELAKKKKPRAKQNSAKRKPDGHDSSSSPSENETSRKSSSKSISSATCPSDNSGNDTTAAIGRSTSHGTHSVPRSKHRIKLGNARPLRGTWYHGNPPSDAAHQNFSLPVEKNESSRSTTPTSRRNDCHSTSSCTIGPRPSREQRNPLDTSATLPPPTTHVTLQHELRTDPSAQTPCDYISDCSSHSRLQQNPARDNPRKTRLRRRSTTSGRTMLGTENQRELRKCETMRFLPDQLQLATNPLAHAVPGSTDPDAHYETTTFPGAHLSDVVYVAAAQPPIDRNKRQAAETPQSSYTAKQGADAATIPNPTHSVGREQIQQPRSTQKYQRTYTTHGANDDLRVARRQPSPTSTGSGQRKLANRRVSTHAQEGQLSRSARRTTSATATDGPSIPIIDGFVSKSYAALLATSQDDACQSPAVTEDLPPQYEFVGSLNHLGVPTSYLPTKFRRTLPTDDSPLAHVTFDQLLQENDILPWKFILGSTLGALPPYWEMATSDACLHLHEEAQGATYRDVPICGIGPIGFFLNAESNDTIREYEGQRQALLRFGRLARNTGKCLVLVIYNEPKTGIDLHIEAIKLLCQEVQLPADHPIHLVAYRASALQLVGWLATFTNVVFGVDHTQLSSLILALRSTTDRTESYVHALQLQELFTNLPLKHFALHSGCPSPHPTEHPGHFQTPTILLRTAELFEQLTGTPTDVLLACSAWNLNTIYQLSISLPDCTMTGGKDRGGSEGRPVTEDLSSRQHLALGLARRADHADQAILASHRSTPPDTTLSVVPAVHSPPVARQMCAFCNDAHYPTECTAFQEVNKRMRRLQMLKRCFICLATGHPSSKCPERTTSFCRYCKRSQHHSSLCRSHEVRHATDAPALLPTAADQRPAAAARSVAKGAGPIPRIPDAAHSVAPGTFPPALNHFRVDQTSSTKKAGTRAAPRSAKRRSAAVSTTPAQGPSKQPSRPTYKLTTAKSSGKRRQVHATIAAEPSSTDHPAPSKTSNKQTRNCAPHSEKTEHPSCDEKAHHRSMSPQQNPLTETSARPTQHADVRCELCTQHHRAERCTSFRSIEERRQRAQYLWLCFTCLSNDHRTEDCPNVVMFSCTLCDYDIHHHALCAAAFRHATGAAETSSTSVVVSAEAHQRLLAPHPAEGLHQSTSVFAQRHTAQSIRGSTCKRIFRGGFGPNPLGLTRLSVQTQAPPKDPLQADPTHPVGASQALNPTSNASTRGGTASSRARGRGYVMKRPSDTTRPPYDVSPDYPDTDPPTVTDQSEPTKPPTGTAPEETADATEAVETPDEHNSATNPASNAGEAVGTSDAQIIPSNPSHSDGPSPTAPIRPPTTTGPSNWPNVSSQQAVVASLPTAAGPSISRPPADIANIFGEQALAALAEQVAQQATLRFTAALDKKLGNIEELPRERSDDQHLTTMAEDRRAPKRQNRKPKK